MKEPIMNDPKDRSVGFKISITQDTWDRIQMARESMVSIHQDVVVAYHTRDGVREIALTIDEFLTKVGF